MFAGVAAGTTYQVTVQNAAGCISAATAAVVNTQPAAPAAPAVDITQPTCAVATGTITVTAPVGAGLTYSIDGVTYTNTTGVFAGVAAGTTYQVTVQNAAGCISAATAAVVNTQPTSPAAPTVDITQPTCAVATGTITVTAPVGAGLTYSIDGVTYTNTTGVFAGVAAGTTYQVTVQNAAGCISAATAAVVNTQPTTPAVPTVNISGQLHFDLCRWFHHLYSYSC